MLELNQLKFSFQGNSDTGDFKNDDFEFSLTLQPKSFNLLIGQSGIGKTTLLNLIAGFHKPDSGDIIMNGKSIVGLKPGMRNIGFLFQEHNLFPHFSVWQNLALPLKNQKKPDADAQSYIGELLEIFEISHLQHKLTANLSGGEKQRTALARIFVQAQYSQLDILLLDEPLSALDKKLRVKLGAEIANLTSAYNLVTLLVSHHPEEFDKNADSKITITETKTIHHHIIKP